MRSEPRPPRVAQWLLALRRLGTHRSEVESDLLELFAARLTTHGRWIARWRYLTDVASLWKWRPRPGSTNARSAVSATLDYRSAASLWFDSLWQDVRSATRTLARTPAFTVFSIITLALGIGATTAIYSVVYSTVLRPPDIRDIDQVVNIYHSDWGSDRGRAGSLSMLTMSWPDYEDLSKAQTSLGEITAWTRFRQTLVGHGMGEVVLGEMVGGEYFHLLGVQPALGRLLQPADDQAGAMPVIVLSDALWRGLFAANPAVVGQGVVLGGQPFQVVGVAPSFFRGVDMPNLLPTAAWIPIHTARHAAGVPDATSSDREERRWFVKGRLKPGRTLEDVRAEVRNIGARLDAAYPMRGHLKDGEQPSSAFRTTPTGGRHWYVVPAAGVRMHESVHAIAGWLAVGVMTAVGLVLLVACSNLANLLLARGATRRQETAVRLALGASRWQLVRAHLVESGMVACAGGIAAVGVARVLMVYLMSASMRMAPGITVQAMPTLAPSVVLVAVLATGLALAVFGVLPALHLTRSDVRDALATDNATSAVPRWRARRNLIAVQVAVSAALVSITTLCLQQITVTALRDSGIDLEHLAVVSIDFQMQHQPEATARHTLTLLVDAVRRQPGVQAVAVSSGLPVGTGTPGATVATAEQGLWEGQVRGQPAELLVSTPPVFRTLGVSIREGRAFDERDGREAMPVAVISEATARALFGRQPAVGRQVLVQRRRWAGESERPAETRTVIGVASDTDTGAVGRQRDGAIYLPSSQYYEPKVTVVARASGDPTPLVAAMKRLTKQVDPELAIFDAGTGVEIGGPQNLAITIAAGVAGTLGLLALVLAMTGLYGVLSHVVARRTREIGLRMVLGADRSHLIRMVLFDGVRPVVEGVTIGFAFGSIVRVALPPAVVHVPPAVQPLTLLAAAAPFVIAALLACYFPARRASRLEPSVALRDL